MTEQVGRGPEPGEARGDSRRPPRLQVVRLEHREGNVVSVVLRGWQRSQERGDFLRMWRLVVQDGLVVLQQWEGTRPVPLGEIPGLAIDLARTVALDALGHLDPRWEV